MTQHDGEAAAVTIVHIAATDTHQLRRSVLRNGGPGRPVTLSEDAHPDAFHLGVRDAEAEIVAISSWIPKSCADPAVANAIQLRGMATATHVQGAGFGGLLLEAGALRCAEMGYELLWARARDSALVFYERHGCRVVGDGFVDVVTGLPHHIVVRDLAGPGD